MTQRKIIHIDMDAFFAAVEQRDFPKYRGLPLAVGHREGRSVVATASYEARKYGIKSAMPMKVALIRCPNIIIANPRFEVYKKVSNQIRKIFFEYTDLVEPLSIDEAYLDVTNPKKGLPSASLIAKEIKERIKKETGLIASAGVSYNKFLAKIASDMDKPDGFYLIKPSDAEAFLDKLDIGLFYGIGKVTKEKFFRMNIFKGRDLKKLSQDLLVQLFGKIGNYYYNVVRGIDDRPVTPSREIKSVGTERTFETDVYDINVIQDKLSEIIDKTWERLSNNNKKGKTVTMKMRFADFSTITRSYTKKESNLTKEDLINIIPSLLPLSDIQIKRVRLLGVTVSNFYSEKKHHGPIQLSFNFKP